MKNAELVRVFNLIADLLELKDDNPFKIRSYRKAAETIAASEQEMSVVAEAGQLRAMPGIGEAIAKKIEELLKTGKLEFLQRLEAEVPPDVLTLKQVPGIGAKTAMTLYKNLGIKGTAELEQAIRDGRVAALDGVGEKKAAALLKSIEALNQRDDSRILLGIALPASRRLIEQIKTNDPTITHIWPTGALRRGEETVSQISIVAASDDNYETLEAFLKLPNIAQIVKRRDYKVDVVLQDGLKVEFIACFPEQLATTLMLTTATTEFRGQLRDLAYKRGYELALGGFVKGEEIWPARDEDEVFRYLGLPYLPPELRTGQGEIEAVLKGEANLDLVTLDDIKGDLHSHSTWSDGSTSLEEMARAAVAKGYRYLLATDHSKGLGMVRGLDEAKLLEQQREIERINNQFAKEGLNFRLLSGAEVEIKADGSLDFDDHVLASMDIVVASLHTSLRQGMKQITNRLLTAMNNPHVDIIAHPTGRLISHREPADLIMPKVLVAARETGTIMEINAGPDRLDLRDAHIKEALGEKVKLVISSDAHAPRALDNMEYGVITARRGGASAADILNTLDLPHLLQQIKQ